MGNLFLFCTCFPAHHFTAAQYGLFNFFFLFTHYTWHWHARNIVTPVNIYFFFFPGTIKIFQLREWI